MSETKGAEQQLKKWALIGVAGIVVTWVLFGVLTWLAFGKAWDRSGTFGDTFGGVNALFSGLARWSYSSCHSAKPRAGVSERGAKADERGAKADERGAYQDSGSAAAVGPCVGSAS